MHFFMPGSNRFAIRAFVLLLGAKIEVRVVFVYTIYELRENEVMEMKHTHSYFEEIRPYIEKADQLTKEMFFSLSPLYKKELGKWQDITVPLFATLHSSSESIYILLNVGAVFDADILLRTVMEGTLKYCYLMKGSEEEREDKYIEYAEMLADIERLIDHQRAVEAIGVLREYSTNNILPFEAQVLSENEVRQLQQKYPAKTRNELKQRWNYQNLLRTLSQSDDMYRAQLGSLSTYALTSHLCHYDSTGLSMRQNQIGNSNHLDQNYFDIGHSRRILSNTLSMYLFRVLEYIKYSNYTSERIVSNCEEVFELINCLDGLNNSVLNDVEKNSDT